MANPLRTPKLWDTFKLGGVISPGQCEVEGGHSPRKWDVWRGFGLSGAATVFMGIDIDKFTIHLIMWTAEQFDDYNANLVPILATPPRGTRPKALDFYHPSVSEPPLNVRAVGVVDITQPKMIGDGELWGVDIMLIPYMPPKPHVAKPIAADDKRPEPEDEYDRMLLTQQGQIKDLSKPR